MTFRYERHYIGKVRGVIFDWAGTTVDYGCFAPITVFRAGFAAKGVEITMAEAREPMGKAKRDHIKTIMAMPRVNAAWSQVHGAVPADDDVQAIYDAFLPKQIEIVGDYAELIPGTVETVQWLREHDIQIGSCTGYTREIMNALMPVAAANGYAPDFLVTSDEVAAGRPAPWMALENAHRMNIYPMSAIVKVGDTVTDILEGLNAGMWTIGVAKTGNELGLSADEVKTLAPSELAARLQPIREKFYQAGAHFVVDDIGSAPAVIEQINDRLSAASYI